MKFRSRVALGLGLPDDERAFTILTARLAAASDEREYKRASFFIEVLKSARPAEVLGTALLDAELRLSAAVAIIRLGKSGVNQLCLALNNPDKDVRLIAIEYLTHYATHSWQYAISPKQTRLHLSKAVSGLIHILKEDTHKLRIEAAEALGVLGDNSAVEQLIATGTDESEHVDVRFKAIEALGNMADERVIQPLLDLLSNSQKSIQIAAIAAFTDAAEARDSHYHPSEHALIARAQIVHKLILERAVGPLILLLGDPNKKVQKRIIKALGEIGGEHAVTTLISLLNTRNVIRDEAIYALISAGDAKAVEPLISIFENKDESTETRSRVASGMAQFTDERVANALLAALKDHDIDVREDAIETLGYLREKRAVGPLIAIVLDNNETTHLRSVTVTALGYIRNKMAVDPLLTALVDDSLRSEAILALGRLRDRRAVEPLLALLDDPERSTRNRAATSLGLLGDSRAVAPLVKMLQTEEVDTRADIARALGRIGDPFALPALEWVRDHDADICCSTYEARDAATDAIRNIKRRKKYRRLLTLTNSLNSFSEDFMAQREQPEEQRRNLTLD